MSLNSYLIGNYAHSQYAFLNSSNYPMGTDNTPNTVSNGTATHAYLYNKQVSLGGLGKTYEVIKGKGGGRIWVNKITGISDTGNMALTLSGEDPTLQSYWNGSVVDTTTNPNHMGFSPNHENPSLPNFMSVHSSEYHDVNGNTKWRNCFVLNHQVAQTADATQSDSGGTNPNTLSFELVPNRSNRLPWGQLFSANANTSTYDNGDYIWIVKGDYPLAITTYIDDGSSTSDAFTLGYAPAVTTIGEFYVYNEGVTDASNVSIASDGDVSLTAANTAGDIMVVIYPTLFAAAG